MVYDSSSNTNDEIKIVHKLVSQVTRAFMDPPFVVIMERLMTGDMHHAAALTNQIGLGKNIKDLEKFMELLSKQRMVKRFINVENKQQSSVQEDAGQKKQTTQRKYFYIDYHELVLVVKYRLAKMMAEIESGMKKETTEKTDYKCPYCQKEYKSTEIFSLMQPTLNDSEHGDFALICEECGGSVVEKMNEEEKSEADRKMEKFNEAMGPMRRTLQMVEKIQFERFDPVAWLQVHVPNTVIVPRNEKGEIIKKDKAWRVRLDYNGVILTEEEKIARREKEAQMKLDREANKDTLPEWHTQSTITGDKTELGKGHEKLQQKIADRKARASALQDDDKGDATDAQLNADLSKLLAAEAAAAAAAANNAINSETAPSTAEGSLAADEDDQEDDQEDVGEPALNDAQKAEALEALRETLILVDGVEKKWQDIEDDEMDKMDHDAYTHYFQIMEEIDGIEGGGV